MQTTLFYTVLLASFFVPATADSLKAQTITHVPLYTFNGDNEDDEFGHSVSGAGDVNGDGLADLIVGARADDNNGDRSGSARVLSGSDGTALFNFDGDSANDSFGGSVSGAGDVNGDGLADLIVGALGDDNNGSNSGSARVLSGADGSVMYNFDGDSASDLLGGSVSGAGDVNGDGRDDLIVGAPGADSARVLSGIDGSVLYDFDGGNVFGSSVSGAGDVNGDGRADLIVGALGDLSNGFGSGSARVFSGIDGSVLNDFDGNLFGTSVSGAGDVNGDGRADLIVVVALGDVDDFRAGSVRVLSGSDGTVLHNFDGDPRDGLNMSVSGAGDVNGDGFADLIVGDPSDIVGSNLGSARVYSGIDGSVLYDFDGDANDEFGFSVSGAGDVNGDGLDDFIVGARRGGANGGGFARVFVSQISAVPEPTSMAVLLLGYGLANMRRRRSAA